MTPSGASVSALSTWFLLTLAPVIGASRSPGSVQSSSSPFSFGERLGLVFIAEASACSCLAVTCLLLYFAFNVIHNRRSVQSTRPKLINTHVDIYFLNLLAFDVLQSIGGIINAKWVADAAISPGPLCDSQGILKNAGALGGAMFILAITIHTAAALLWKWKVPKSFAIPLVITLAIWLFIALGIGVSWSLYRHRQYIDITGMWCWIGSDFKNQRLLFEYAWMWITVFFNLLVYIPLYFSLRGNLSVSGFHVKWTSLSPDDSWLSHAKAGYVLAGSMLWYPLAYTITVIPFSICRWRTFNGYSVPWAATVVADILFCSSGLVNSLLYPLTRPSLLPAGRHHRCSDSFISPPLRSSSITNKPRPGGVSGPEPSSSPPCSVRVSDQSLSYSALGVVNTSSGEQDVIGPGHQPIWGGIENGFHGYPSRYVGASRRRIHLSDSSWPPHSRAPRPQLAVLPLQALTFPAPAATSPPRRASASYPFPSPPTFLHIGRRSLWKRNPY